MKTIKLTLLLTICACAFGWADVELCLIATNEQGSRIVTAFDAKYPTNTNYTNRQWVKKQIAEYIKRIVLDYETAEAEKELNIELLEIQVATDEVE